MRLDLSQAKVGDTLYLTQRQGWNGWKAEEWTVARKTPSGQLLCRRGYAELRVNKHGRITGNSAAWGTFVSAEEAAELNADLQESEEWRAICHLAQDLEKAARRKQRADAFEIYDRLAQAIEARRAATLGAVHESAVDAIDAPDLGSPQSTEDVG